MAIYLTIALIILLIAILIAYNSIIYRKNQVDNAFAGIDTMLKKRYELIPALTETVKAYMAHERELLEGVTRLRNLYLSENQQSGKIEFADQLARQVGELFVQVENYPQL
ncbi:MAG: LemA family protein, partial [Sphingobacteriales bacterium]|nr:LemA family protein [Sphingobacteriales bacterium]